MIPQNHPLNFRKTQKFIRDRGERIILTNPTAPHALAHECYDACKSAEQLVQNRHIAVKASAELMRSTRDLLPGAMSPDQMS